MLLAEHFKFNRFYFVDDDIETFLQYDDYERKFIGNNPNQPKQAYHALKFMSSVLDHSINHQANNFDIDKDISMGWSDKLAPLARTFVNSEYNSEIQRLRTLITYDLPGKRDEMAQLFWILSNSLPIENTEEKEILLRLYEEIKEKLYGYNIKIIGQIGMLKNNSIQQNRDKEDRLRSLDKSTHFVSAVRYQLVLYNLDAIHGIHPVSEKVMFEECLNRQLKADLVKRAKDKELDNEVASKAARMGYKYSDKAHVLYQIANGISGYQVYYYSFRDQINIPSKVNSDDTLDEDEIENDL